MSEAWDPALGGGRSATAKAYPEEFRRCAGEDSQVLAFEGYHFGSADGGAARAGKKSAQLGILVLSYMALRTASTVREHCDSLIRYSRHKCFHYNPVDRPKPKWLDLDAFDVIVIHYSIYSISDEYLDPSWVRAIADCGACKVMFIQDEYRQVNAFTGRMLQLGIDVLFTCVPFGEVRKVYPQDRLPNTKLVCTLTGFVPDWLGNRPPGLDVRRPIDVGYRGREIGYHYGELGRGKWLIGERFRQLAEGSGLVCDISSREEDRIYGRAWPRWLRSCRCVLGTESGASVFDFSGEIEEKTQRYLAANPQASFETVRDLFFKGEDGRINMGQISPRVFEAMACGACLVLFEGEYSGIIKPDAHYIPLKKDFSNWQEVLLRIKDIGHVRDTAARAYKDIIAPGRYSYRAFVEGFDRALAMTMPERGSRTRSLSQNPSPPGTLWVPLPVSGARGGCFGIGTERRAAAEAKGRAGSGRLRYWVLHLPRRIGDWWGCGHERWRCRFRNIYHLFKGRWIRLLTDWQPVYSRSYVRLLLYCLKRRISRAGKQARHAVHSVSDPSVCENRSLSQNPSPPGTLRVPLPASGARGGCFGTSTKGLAGR